MDLRPTTPDIVLSLPVWERGADTGGVTCWDPDLVMLAYDANGVAWRPVSTLSGWRRMAVYAVPMCASETMPAQEETDSASLAAEIAERANA